MKELTKDIAFIFGISYVVGLLSSICYLNNIGLPIFPSNLFLSINELFYGSIMVLLAIITRFTSYSFIISEPIKDADNWTNWLSAKRGKAVNKIYWVIRFIMTLGIYVCPYIIIFCIIIIIITNYNYKALLYVFLIYFLIVGLSSINLYRDIKERLPKDDQPMLGKYASFIFGPEKEDIVIYIIGILIIALLYSYNLYQNISPTFGGGMPLKVIPFIEINYKNNLIFNDNSKLDNQEVYLIGQSLEFLAFTTINDKSKKNVLFVRRDKLIALKNIEKEYPTIKEEKANKK